jgi:hypothetical protein
MEEMNQTPQAPPSAPGFLKTLVVLTYIFSSIFILICLLGVFASGWLMSMIPGGGLPIQGGAAVGIIIAVCLIIIGLELVTMIGASKMAKLKKSGFWMWIIPNGVYLLLSLFSLSNATAGTIFFLLVTIFMFVGYIANFKHLK